MLQMICTWLLLDTTRKESWIRESPVQQQMLLSACILHYTADGRGKQEHSKAKQSKKLLFFLHCILATNNGVMRTLKYMRKSFASSISQAILHEKKIGKKDEKIIWKYFSRSIANGTSKLQLVEIEFCCHNVSVSK